MILPDCRRLLLVSTNWDTVVDDALKNHPILRHYIRTENFCTHLHGSFHDPDTIYLPTEVVNEKYRTKEQNLHMWNIHKDTLHNLKSSDSFIIYGLSLSPLDAELCQILGASISINENLEIIKIIDIKTRMCC